VTSMWIIRTNQTISWLMHSWNIFGARTNHEHTQTHKTHHNPNLGEVTAFPLIIFSMINHKGYIQMSFCPDIPKSGSQNFQNWDS
jgi:hypothetical protein